MSLSVVQPDSKERKALDTEKGEIFNIQRCSLQDGPGVRTTFFLKGCPLRCQWCDNPESQLQSSELAHRRSPCDGCGACIKVCEPGAISLTTDGKAAIDRELCNICGQCVSACPQDALAIYGSTASVTELFDELSRDIHFYKNSDGGVTASGGEPLMQPKFVSAVFSLCHRLGIPTAIDTCGYVEQSVLSEILPVIDLVLYDLKHMDSATHEKFTGVPNELILENAKAVAAAGVPLIFRIPLVAAINDSEENIREVCDFSIGLGVADIDLLPFHQYGLSKYAMLGRSDGPVHLKTTGQEHINRLKEIIQTYGLTCKIGG